MCGFYVNQRFRNFFLYQASKKRSGVSDRHANIMVHTRHTYIVTQSAKKSNKKIKRKNGLGERDDNNAITMRIIKERRKKNNVTRVDISEFGFGNTRDTKVAANTKHKSCHTKIFLNNVEDEFLLKCVAKIWSRCRSRIMCLKGFSFPSFSTL